MIKSGKTTSEFWVILITGIITALGKALKLPDQMIAWLVSLALGYLGSRTILKSIGVRNGVK